MDEEWLQQPVSSILEGVDQNLTTALASLSVKADGREQPLHLNVGFFLTYVYYRCFG